MDLVVSRSDHGTVSVFAVEGEFRAFTPSFRELQAQVLGALSEGRLDLIVDCGKLEYADSTALGNLVGIHMDVRRQGGRMALCNLLPGLARVIEKANLQRYFHIQPSVTEGLAMMKAESMEAS